jgi:hypothetical protein
VIPSVFFRKMLPALSVLMLLGTPCWAQAVYKSTMPDGRVIYSDAPIPGAKKVEQMAVTAPSPGGGAPAAGERAPGEAKALQQEEQQLRARMAERDAKQQRVRDAEKALRQAEEAKRNGEEPLPGERLGTAGGGSRLSDEYWERQKQLEQNVDLARKALNDARAAAQ